MNYGENNEVEGFYFLPFIPFKSYYFFVWKIEKKRFIYDSKSVSNYRRIIT